MRSRTQRIGWLTSSVLASAAQAGEPPERYEPPAITTERYSEDYSYLRNPANRSGAWWEPLKYVALHQDAGIYLTLGDELRVQYEHRWDYDFGSFIKPEEGYVWYRQLPYADLHLGTSFRAFGQFIIAYAERSPITKSAAVDETGVDLLQGFIDWRLFRSDGAELNLRAGRFLMTYGSGRLIDMGPNVLRPFDGALAQLTRGNWHVDALLLRPVSSGFGWFDNRSTSSRQLFGLYTTVDLEQIGSGAGADVYYLNFADGSATFNQGSGSERRHTFGVRFFGSSGQWQWDWEADFQTGTFADDNIQAWSIATAHWRYFDLPLNPHVSVRANIIGGDEDPDDTVLGTFNPMFPTSEYYGDIRQVGPSNLISVRPMIGIDLGSGWTASGAATLFWRQSLGDGLYSASLNLVRPSGASRSSYIGTETEFVLDWVVNRNISFRAVYSVFRPGQFIADTGPAEVVRFLMSRVQFSY